MMIQVIGYTEVNGVKTASDDVLLAIYNTLIDEGTLNIVFSTEGFRDEKEFIYFMKNPNNLIAFIVVENEIMGFGWINGIQANHATAHYAFFKKAWGRYTVDMAKALMDYWFNPAFPFDVLIGKTPEWNRKAVKFLERIGWTVLGTIPFLSDGDGMVISYMTRSDYGRQKEQ